LVLPSSLDVEELLLMERGKRDSYGDGRARRLGHWGEALGQWLTGCGMDHSDKVRRVGHDGHDSVKTRRRD
jgi:hypothetical protein